MAKDRFPMPKGLSDPKHFPWPPATEAEVLEVEKTVGARLPDDYRKFLKTRNGFNAKTLPLAIPIYNAYLEMDEPYVFNTLFTTSAEAGEHSALLPRQDDYRFKTRVARRLMIIGCTLGADRICMSISGHDQGHVYHWYPRDVDSWEQVERNSEDHLMPLANSFSEFWSKLYLADDL